MHCPRWTVHLNHLPGPSPSVSWVRHESAVSGVPVCLLWGADLSLQPSWRMSAVQDPRTTCLAVGACSQLVVDANSGVKTAPYLLALAVAHLPLCLWLGEGPLHSRMAFLWHWLNPLFCEWARLHLRLELFMGKFSLSLFFSPLWLSHSLGCYLTLAPLDCSQGIQAWSLP